MPDEQNDARSKTSGPDETPPVTQETKIDVQTDIDSFDKVQTPVEAVPESAPEPVQESVPEPEPQPIEEPQPATPPRTRRTLNAADFKAPPKAEPKPAVPEAPSAVPSEPIRSARPPEPVYQDSVRQEYKPEPPKAAPAPEPVVEHKPEPVYQEPVRQEYKPEPPKAAPIPAYVPEPAVSEPKTEYKAPETPRYDEPVKQEPAPAQPDEYGYQAPRQEPPKQEEQWDRYGLDSQAEQEPKQENNAEYNPGYNQGYDQQYANNNNAPVGGIDGALKGIISFFTIFKLNVTESDIKATESKMFLAPIAGLIIGVIAAVIAAIFFKIGSPNFITTIPGFGTVYIPDMPLGTAAAALSLGAVFVLSKFLHFDGLADFGDGIVVSGDREKHIRALKDSRVGAGGVAFALIVTLISFGFLSSIGGLFAIVAVIAVVEIFAKNAMVATAAFGEPGNGMASEQVRQTDINSLLFSTILSVGLAVASFFVLGIIALVITGATPFESHTIISAIVAIVASAAVSIGTGFLMSKIANKNFGYVNGDVLGAANEVGRALALIISFVVFFIVML
ncbi:MAG: adenosylcobinamide-GDP ribazoletransferase [Candidatus Methanoplasma sp.]|jgi:adenosylcobinamide-GDP ribazoletransferase|nr:adenosylcobinamide-GDP ribazoletransferase [Candidatus Methanoplasma sp.]